MKKMKRRRVAAALLLLLFCAASWGLTAYGRQQELSGFTELRETADGYYDKQIYDEALVVYKSCLKAEPDDLYCLERVASIYSLTGQDSSCIAWCERVLRQDPHALEFRLMEARSYDNKQNIASAIRVLERAEETDGTEAQREEQTSLLRELKGRYDLTYFTFQNVYPWFFLPDGTPAATVEEEKGLAVYTDDGKQLLSGAFSFLGASADDRLLFPVQDAETWCCVDETGERRLVPDRPYSSLLPFSEGLAPATRIKDGGDNGSLVAGYLDRDLREQRFEFETACPMVDGRALVRRDGSWFLLDESLQEISACEFTEVKRDVYGNAQKYGLLLGRLPDGSGQWGLYDPVGNRISDFSADDIRLPEADKSALAFCRDGLWGFVTPKGEVLLEPRFEDAKSFSKGMAPVRKDGKWGYIDRTGDFLIPPTFDDAGAFSKNGATFVKNHAGYSLLKLRRYQSAET